MAKALSQKPGAEAKKGLRALLDRRAADSTGRELHSESLGRAWSQDRRDDPINLFSDPAVAVRRPQRRHRCRKAQRHVEPQGDKRCNQYSPKEDSSQFTHAYTLDASAVKWNPDATWRTPQMSRMKTWNYLEGPTCFGNRRLLGPD